MKAIQADKEEISKLLRQLLRELSSGELEWSLTANQRQYYPRLDDLTRKKKGSSYRPAHYCRLCFGRIHLSREYVRISLMSNRSNCKRNLCFHKECLFTFDNNLKGDSHGF